MERHLLEEQVFVRAAREHNDRSERYLLLIGCERQRLNELRNGSARVTGDESSIYLLLNIER